MYTTNKTTIFQFSFLFTPIFFSLKILFDEQKQEKNKIMSFRFFMGHTQKKTILYNTKCISQLILIQYHTIKKQNQMFKTKANK